MQCLKSFFVLLFFSYIAACADPLETSVYTQPDTLIPEEPATPIPVLEPPHKSPSIAVGLSVLWPGLGHVYLGDYRTAGEFLFGTGLGFASLKTLKNFELTTLAMLSNTWFYGIYATYRDVRLFNNDAGYHYKMPKESLADLSFAPFRWSIIKKPEVWGGVLGSLVLAATVGYLTNKDKIQEERSSIADELTPFVAFPVSIGEETFFRGYLQSQLSETFTPWGGIALSSLLFAAAHASNAELLPKEERKDYYTHVLPLLATFGAYSGWLTYKNSSLKESVAVHAWYDFTLLSLVYLAKSEARVKPKFVTGFRF